MCKCLRYPFSICTTFLFRCPWLICNQRDVRSILSWRHNSIQEKQIHFISTVSRKPPCGRFSSIPTSVQQMKSDLHFSIIKSNLFLLSVEKSIEMIWMRFVSRFSTVEEHPIDHTCDLLCVTRGKCVWWQILSSLPDEDQAIDHRWLKWCIDNLNSFDFETQSCNFFCLYLWRILFAGYMYRLHTPLS